MNKLVIIYIKGEKFNKMFKWNYVEDFKADLENGVNIPNMDDIVVEAYVDDNLIDMGNTFRDTVRKMKLISII